jgi:hypothetical protein
VGIWSEEVRIRTVGAELGIKLTITGYITPMQAAVIILELLGKPPKVLAKDHGAACSIRDLQYLCTIVKAEDRFLIGEISREKSAVVPIAEETEVIAEVPGAKEGPIVGYMGGDGSSRPVAWAKETWDEGSGEG